MVDSLKYKFLYDFHLACQFAVQMTLWTGSFCALFILSVFLEKVDIFMDHNAAPGLIVRYLAMQIPFWAWKAAPLAFLGASLAVLDQANRSGELVALESLGRRPMRAYLPFLFFACIFFAAGELGMESESPRFYRNSRSFLKTKIEGRTLKHLEPLDNFIAKGGGGRYFVFGRFDPASSQFENFWFEEWENSFRKRQIFASKGHFDAQKRSWRLEKAVERTYRPKEEMKYSENLALALQEEPQDLLPSVWKLEEMTLGELKEAAELSREKGIAAKSLLSEYYYRLAWPLSFLVLVLTAVGAVGLFPKTMFQGKLLLFGVTLVTGLAYWFLVHLSKTLASHGILPVISSAWLPHAGIIAAIAAARPLAARLLGRI